MDAVEFDYERISLLGLRTRPPSGEHSWFWIVHTLDEVSTFLQAPDAIRCLGAGGAVLFVSRGGGYEDWTAQRVAGQLSSVPPKGRSRVHVLGEPFQARAAARVGTFVRKVVPTLKKFEAIAWEDMNSPPAPDALIAYYVLGLLGAEAAAERDRIRGDAVTEFVALGGHPSALDDVEAQERLGAFLKSLRRGA